MSEHTATPWEYRGPSAWNPSGPGIPGQQIGKVGSALGLVAMAWSEADALYIVRCVNGHADLLAALKGLTRDLDLQDVTAEDYPPLGQAHAAIAAHEAAS